MQLVAKRSAFRAEEGEREEQEDGGRCETGVKSEEQGQERREGGEVDQNPHAVVFRLAAILAVFARIVYSGMICRE